MCMGLQIGHMVKETFNMGVRQGCGISPLPFSLYLINVTHKWKQELEVLNITNNFKTKNCISHVCR